MADTSHAFEENVTAFYMAFAEDNLEQMCQSLSNMRLVVQDDHAARTDNCPAQVETAAVRQEMLEACELKALSAQSKAVEQLKRTCMVGDDIDKVLTQFYVCVELGAGAEAAPSLTGCLSRIFKTQARVVFDKVTACKATAPVNEHGYIERNFYVEAMSELLTGTTEIMNAVADTTTSPAMLKPVLTPIHETCTQVALEIVQLYAVDARMTAWERRAMAQARRDPNDPATEIEADESLQMVDLFLDELSFLIRLLMSYSSFLASLSDEIDTDRSKHSFQAKIQELNGVYLILERFYIFQSVHKATAIAEVQELEANVFVSSMVEDVSFVLNKAFMRASQCMNYHTALSIVMALVDALESMYLPAILDLPKRPFVIPLSTTSAPTASLGNGSDSDDEDGQKDAISFSEMLLQAVDDDLTRAIQDEAKMIMAINSSFMSGEFVEGLDAKIAEFSAAAFPQETSICDCLPKHISELTEAFRSIVNNEIQEVLSHGIRKRTEPLITQQIFEKFVYELTAADYDTYGLHGSPMNRMIQNDVMKNKVLRRYEQALCTTPFESLVESFVADLTTWVERALVNCRKPFNDLGALQLEREVSEMLQRVSTFVKDKSLRGAFTRLFHVVLILNLVHPSDVSDYYDAIKDELDLPVIEALLRMRVDFKPDDIDRAMQKLNSAIPATQG